MDVIATSPRMDLEGRSSAQLLADGQVDLAVQVIRMAGMRCSPWWEGDPPPVVYRTPPLTGQPSQW